MAIKCQHMSLLILSSIAFHALICRSGRALEKEQVVLSAEGSTQRQMHFSRDDEEDGHNLARNASFAPTHVKKADLTLVHFAKSTAGKYCYERKANDAASNMAVVDAHLHSFPFGGKAQDTKLLMTWLKNAGVLFTMLNGIGQKLPDDQPCTYYVDCPGVPMGPTDDNDVKNMNFLRDYGPSEAGKINIDVSMTFLDFAHVSPAKIAQRMTEMMDTMKTFEGGNYRSKWMGEVNLVKQAINKNKLGLPVDPEMFASFAPFMNILESHGMVIGVHSDLGCNKGLGSCTDSGDAQRYLHLMEKFSKMYRNNKIVWLHLGGMSKELKPISVAGAKPGRATINVTNVAALVRQASSGQLERSATPELTRQSSARDFGDWRDAIVQGPSKRTGERTDILHAHSHVKILDDMLKDNKNLYIDLAWDVLYTNCYDADDKVALYAELMNRNPYQFITGTDFVAAGTPDKTEAAYKDQLGKTSHIFQFLSDFAFQRIALGQNYFDISCGGGLPKGSAALGLATRLVGVGHHHCLSDKYSAPKVCPR